MSSQSTLEYTLVGLLRTTVQSGYDLRKAFTTTPLAHFSDSPGSIYPALRRIERKRWIEAVQEDGGPRNRQRFRITPDGEQRFLEWLDAPVTRADIISGTDTLMMRFAFMDGAVSRAKAGEFLAALERQLEEYLAELKAYLAKVRPTMASSTGLLAIEGGVDGFAARLAWARRALNELREADNESHGGFESARVLAVVRGGDGPEWGRDDSSRSEATEISREY